MTSKTNPVVMDQESIDIINRIAEIGDQPISKLLRDWIRQGIISSPFFEKANSKQIPMSDLCLAPKPGRPKIEPLD